MAAATAAGSPDGSRKSPASIRLPPQASSTPFSAAILDDGLASADRIAPGAAAAPRRNDDSESHGTPAMTTASPISTTVNSAHAPHPAPADTDAGPRRDRGPDCPARRHQPVSRRRQPRRLA